MSAATTMRAVLGSVAGLIWFLVLSGAEVHRHSPMVEASAGPWDALVLVAATSALCLLGFRALGTVWGWGVSSGLVLGMLLGLIEGPLLPDDAPAVFSIPASFAVGLGSLAVWVALGVALALSATSGAARRQRESAEPVSTVPTSS